MILKGIVFTALLASTPIAIVATQDPKNAADGAVKSSAKATTTTAAANAALEAARAESRQWQERAERSAADLAGARRELAGAQKDLQKLGAQLEHALDQLDTTFAPQRDRNCSPTRSRALMSHYQWLRQNGHEQRANATIDRVAEAVGNDPNRINSEAWDLMNDKDTAGKFDEVALALVQRIEAAGKLDNHRLLDTAALAHFLNGEVAQAVALEAQAIERGGRDDEFRRRLRTYQAALDAVAKASAAVAPTAETLIAGKD